MHLLHSAIHQGAVLRPIVLQLLARCGLEAYRRPRLAQRPLGPDVIAQNARLPLITLRLDLAQNHCRIPHPGRQ